MQLKSSAIVFTTDTLTKVKHQLSMNVQSKVVYKVPCSCGKSYVGETVRRLETRTYEPKRAGNVRLKDLP